VSVNCAAVDVVPHTCWFTAYLQFTSGHKSGCAFSSNCLRFVGGVFA